MTAKKPPSLTLDERLSAATRSYLVKVARDPQEHPAIRQAARERLLRPTVEEFGPWIAKQDSTALGYLRAYLRGEPPTTTPETYYTPSEPAPVTEVVAEPASSPAPSLPAEDPDPGPNSEGLVDLGRTVDGQWVPSPEPRDPERAAIWRRGQSARKLRGY